jgi:nitric-oxide synthase
VVDATDFHGSFLNRVRDVVGANPILLVLTKIDLLPRGTDAEKLKDWVFDEVVEKRRLTLAGVVCVSSRKGDGVRDAVGAMFSERKGRDVYVLGSANVGKSTFIRAALRAMREGGNFGVPGKRLPTASAMPGTTLGVIPLRAFEGKGTLYDTPGVFLHHRMNSILSGEDIKRFKLGSTLVKYVPRPRVDGEEVDRASFEGLTLLWGPLLRVDITEATPSASLAFYGPKGLRVRVAETSSLPSGEDIEREVEAREADAAAKRLDDLKALVTEEEEDAGGGVALAPSASAAVEAHREAAAEATTTTTTTTTTTDSDSDSDSDSYSYSDPDPELAPEIFHRRLVKEIFVEAADRDPPGALSDACVSGLGGWIRVRREGRSGETRLNARVWGPRGLEVFVRAPMPCGQ